MNTYTIIVGSAYGDDSRDIYLVQAPTPELGYAHVKRLDEAFKGSPRSILFVMDGEVKFLSSGLRGIDDVPYPAPDVIDLRPSWLQEPAPVPMTEAHALGAIEHALPGVGRFVLFTSIAEPSLETAKTNLRALGQDYQTRGLTIALPIPKSAKGDKLKRTLAKCFGSDKLMGTEAAMMEKMTIVRASNIGSALTQAAG